MPYGLPAQCYFIGFEYESPLQDIKAVINSSSIMERSMVVFYEEWTGLIFHTCISSIFMFYEIINAPIPCSAHHHYSSHVENTVDAGASLFFRRR